MAGTRKPNRKKKQKRRRQMAVRPEPPQARPNWIRDVLAPAAVTAAALFRMVTDAWAFFRG